MLFDEILTSLSYLLACFALFVLGHWVFAFARVGYKIKHELLEKDNPAFGLTLAGYYLGLIFSIGGVIYGPSGGFQEDLVDLLIYGPLAIVLLNLSAIINDRFILSEFNIRKEIIEDQNCGTGVVEFAVFLASGLNIFGAVYGLGGNIYTTIAFWGLGQCILVLIGKYYNVITSFNIHEHIEKDNVAVGVAFAGALIAIGNLLRVASGQDFTSWGDNLTNFFWYVILGLVLLPVSRVITDRVLLPGRTLADELVHQDKPNMAAAYLEAGSYIGSSFLVVWCL